MLSAILRFYIWLSLSGLFRILFLTCGYRKCVGRRNKYFITIYESVLCAASELTHLVVFVFLPLCQSKIQGPWLHHIAKTEPQRKRFPFLPSFPLSLPTSPLSATEAPSLPPLWPALSWKPSSLPCVLPAPRHLPSLLTHQAFVEVHGGLQNGFHSHLKTLWWTC